VGASHWQFNQQASVSVNVSVIQLMDDGFIRWLDCWITAFVVADWHLKDCIKKSKEPTFVENKAKIRQQLE